MWVNGVEFDDSTGPAVRTWVEEVGSVDEAQWLLARNVKLHQAADVLRAGANFDHLTDWIRRIEGPNQHRDLGGIEELLARGARPADIYKFIDAKADLTAAGAYCRYGNPPSDALTLAELNVPLLEAAEAIETGISLEDTIRLHRAGAPLPFAAQLRQLGISVDDTIRLTDAAVDYPGAHQMLIEHADIDTIITVHQAGGDLVAAAELLNRGLDQQSLVSIADTDLWAAVQTAADNGIEALRSRPNAPMRIPTRRDMATARTR